MAWTLYRYVVWELLKLLVVSTTVLVTVISFAAAIKPLSDGLLGPAELVKFVAYSAPTMLAFALPFSGAFASTLVFLRLAADNEVLVCSISGMSYRGILVPVFVLGLAMTLGLFGLSNFVIPGFYRHAERSVQRDLVSVLVTQLNKDRSFDQIEDVVIYADSATEHALTPGQLAQIDSPFPPSRMIALSSVAVARLDDEGRSRGDATAEQANVLVYRDPDSDRTWVTIRLINAMYYDSGPGELVFAEQYDVPPIRLPSPWRDNPKFFSWPQLRRLVAEPDRFDRVRESKRALADAVGIERVRRSLGDKLHGPDREAVFLGPPHAGPLDGRFVLQAPDARFGRHDVALSAVEGRLVVVKYRIGDRPPGRYEAQSATLVIEPGETSPEPRILLKLRGVKLYDPRLGDTFTERPDLTLPHLRWPVAVHDVHPDRLSAAQQLERAGEYGGSRPVNRAALRLLSQINQLKLMIRAQLHERAALAIACLLLMMFGAVLSMRLKGQMPLVVYFWSFLLAVVTLIIIHRGSDLAGQEDWSLGAALGVLWTGNAFLFVSNGVVYCILARN